MDRKQSFFEKFATAAIHAREDLIRDTLGQTEKKKGFCPFLPTFNIRKWCYYLLLAPAVP